MGISFKNIFKPLLAKSNPSVLGIDIGSSSIKVVQLRKQKGKAVLETYGELALGPLGNVEIGQATKLSIDQIVKAVREVLGASSVTTVECGISIPMKSSMVSVITMPLMDKKQLAQMVPIEARKYIPVPTSEVTLDWFQIPELDNSSLDNDKQAEQLKKQEILVVAIHNDVLNNYSTIVNDAQLNTSFFEVEMFSAVRSVLDNTSLNPVLVCDIGAGVTKMYIVERGIIRESHVVNKGSQEITLGISQSMKVSIEFAEKLKRNFGHNTKEQDKEITEIRDIVLAPISAGLTTITANYLRKYNKRVSGITLIGGGAMMEGVDVVLTKAVGIKAEKGDPFEKIETPPFLHAVLEKTGLAFAPAIGLAIRKLQELE